MYSIHKFRIHTITKDEELELITMNIIPHLSIKSQGTTAC